jgi:hypothetical protein
LRSQITISRNEWEGDVQDIDLLKLEFRLGRQKIDHWKPNGLETFAASDSEAILYATAW